MKATSPWRRKRVATAAAMAAALTLAATGCAGSGGGAQSDRVLTIALASQPISLDPSRAAGEGSSFQLPAYSSLLHRPGVGEELVPALAESYEWLDDQNLTLQITLRDDLKFSDGAPLDAEAVRTSIEHFGQAGGPQAYVAEPIESIDTPDDQTVIFHLSEPTPTFLSDLAEGPGMGSIISPNALAGDIEALGTSTDGAGPYMLTAEGTVEGSQYRYAVNPNYPDVDSLAYDEVVIRVISDANTALAALESGQVDVTYGFPDTYERATSAGAQAGVFGGSVNGLWLQDWEGTTVPALADQRVRQALNFAVDREAIAKAATLGLGDATVQAPPAESLGYDAQLNERYPYDPETARELLAEAGYADGFELPIVIPGFVPTATVVAQAVAAQLAEVGVTVNITSATTFPEYAQGQESGQYAATVFPLGLAEGMPSAMTTLYGPTALINPKRVELPDMLALWGPAAATSGAAAQPAWAELNALAVEQAYSVPIVGEPRVFYYDDAIASIGGTAILNPLFVTPVS